MKVRSLMRWISEGFIWAIGITQPRVGQEQCAARYITLLVFAVLVGAAIFFFSFMHAF